MRISTAMLHQRAVDVMLDKQAELSKTEVQLASGKRVLTPSDDPAAMVRTLDLSEAASKLGQYQRNADAATARLTQEETALEGVGNLLQRVRELAVQASNGTMSAADRASIATEVRQHLDGFLQLANTRDANGEYLFAGFKTDTPPYSHDGVGNFSYQGDLGQRRLQVGDSREVAVGDAGPAIFDNLPANAGGTTGIGSILYDLATTLEAGNADTNALADLDSALGQVLDTRAAIGARLGAVDDQYQANEAFQVAVAEVRSSLEDLDYAEAISRYNQQLVALQAAQQSYAKVQGLSLFDYIR